VTEDEDVIDRLCSESIVTINRTSQEAADLIILQTLVFDPE
jgi:hypothetical protein